MATKGPVNGVYFFVFDFFIMQGSSDSNDVLPKAVTYFYPPDEQKKNAVIMIITSSNICLFVFYRNLETSRLRRNRRCCTILST